MSYKEGSNYEYQKENPAGNFKIAHHPQGSRDAKWIKCIFKTKSVDDYRPLVFNPKYPWWCSAESADGSHAIIHAYLPLVEILETYWDDAYDIEQTEHATISFTDRFPRPKYFID